MSVTLVGAEGWFNRQGAFVGEVNRVAGTFYGSALDAGFLSIWLQFASADQPAVQDYPNAVTAFRQSDASYLSTVIADGQTAAILQVNRDNPLTPYTLTQAFTRIRDQMLATAQSINRPTLGSSVSAGSGNLGDTVVVVSTTNKYGDPSDMIFAEDVTVTCTAATGGSSFAATLQAVGETAVAGTDYRWPQGSGCSVTFSVFDPATTGIVTDGGFANWSGTGSNTPTNWTIVDGEAGTTVLRSAGGGLRTGSDAAVFRSDGTQPTKLAQNVTLTPNTVYAVSVQAKTDAADGTMVLQLTDGSGNILTDDAGNNLSYSRNLNGQVTASYAPYTAFFATPRQLPVTVQVRYGFGSAPTAPSEELTIDLAAVVAATPLYNQGPYIAAIAGADRTAVQDVWTATFTNSLGANSFVRGLDRLYSVRDMVNQNGEQVYLPSATSETISDALVTN